MRSLIAAIKMIAFAVMCCLLVPIQMLVLLITQGNPAYILPNYWGKWVCLIFRIKVIKHGKPVTGQQVIYVGNHLSYLDIPVYGSVLQGSFVAKKDVENWPVFGFLSKLQQTSFISRDRIDALAMSNALEEKLRMRKNLIIFPEGTSTDGRRVFPFKSSVFSALFKKNIKDIHVQPITIKMLSTDKNEIKTQHDRDLYAWHLNMDTPLHEHLWSFAKSKGAVIELTFHPAVNTHSFKDRKTLAKHCHDAVCSGL